MAASEFQQLVYLLAHTVFSVNQIFSLFIVQLPVNVIVRTNSGICVGTKNQSDLEFVRFFQFLFFSLNKTDFGKGSIWIPLEPLLTKGMRSILSRRFPILRTFPTFSAAGTS